MLKEFYIRKDHSNAYSLDVSSFASLEQLTRALGEIFAFADAKCVYPPSNDVGKLAANTTQLYHWSTSS
jgi:hypothetical protein